MNLDLTKEQRHEIYKRALVNLKIIIAKEPGWTYVCNLLKKTTKYFKNLISLDNIGIEENFPEFFKFKPSNLDEDKAWWKTDEEGNKQRIQALEKCIELTK